MSTTPPTPRKRKLLVVDDDLNCRRLLVSLLERAGYEVLTACDGDEGYRMVVSERPDIVITDWMMPHVDGIEMIRNIRSQLNWYPYILLVTCKTDQQLGLDMGADDFVLKPIRREQLLPRIRAGERIVTLQERLREKNLELNLVNQQLAELAVTDPLSGLLNRRAFYEQAHNEWLRAARYDLPLSCLMIDIDHFKSVNDRFGHATGDSVIRALAQTMIGNLRETDVICRHGGEEFCALLINTPIDDAVQLAGRLRQVTRDMRVDGLPRSFGISISLGISARTLQVVSEQALIDQADQALLHAKRTGRDRWSRFDELGPDWEAAGYQGESPVDDRSADGNPLVSFQLVNTLLGALSYRDAASVAHCQRVARTCEQFGQQLGLPPAERVLLELAALLHEIGKLALSDQELAQCRQQAESPTAGERLRQRTIEIVDNCLYNTPLANTIVDSECWFDEARPDHPLNLPARILSLVCMYDELLHDRSDAFCRTKAAALEALAEYSGTRFDPELYKEFCAMLLPQKGGQALPCLTTQPG